MPVRIRLLQRSVLRGHCSDEKMSFTMAMSVEAPENLAKEKDDHALRDDLQTAQTGTKAVLVLPGAPVCHACVRKADHARNRGNPYGYVTASGCPYAE